MLRRVLAGAGSMALCASLAVAHGGSHPAPYPNPFPQPKRPNSPGPKSPSGGSNPSKPSEPAKPVTGGGPGWPFPVTSRPPNPGDRGTGPTPAPPKPPPIPPGVNPLGGPTGSGGNGGNGGNGGRRAAAPSLRGWRTWWGLNQRRFLLVKRRRAAATGGEAKTNGDAATLQWLLERLEDDYFDVRSAAAIALGRAGNAGTAGFIQGRLTDPDPDVRESALLGLGLLESPIAVMPLQMVVREERIRPRPRAMATIALGLSRSSVAVPALRHAARSEERLEIRGAALMALGLTGGAEELPLLTAAAGAAAAEPEARALAVNGRARLARRLDDPAITTATLDQLRRLTASSVEPAVRQSAVQAFGLLGDFRALPTLLALLSDEDAMVRRFAAVTAAELARGKSEQAHVYDALAPLLERGRARSESRAFTALALGLLGDRRAGAALLGMLEGESNHDTRAAAAVALGLLPYVPAAQRLTEIAADKGDPALRAYAVLALGMLRDPAGTATLHELLLRAPAPEVRAAAAVSLGLTGGARSPKALAALLADAHVFVRISMVHALGYLRDDGGLQPLMDRFKREPNDDVRTMIVVAVGRIVQRDELAPHHSLARGLNYLHPGLGLRLVIGLE